MILVPRPAPHLPRTLHVLQNAGFAILMPLALSRPQPLPVTIPAAITALLITSPLGVQKGLPNLPTYCVGEATAATARKAGLNVVYTGSNNGVTMARDIFDLKLPRTHFAHLHGDHAGMEWHTILQLAGHMVTPILAYKTQRITKLPNAMVGDLSKLNAQSLTLLFSAGSASHLANLMKHVNIQPTGTAVAFSPLVATAAEQYWPKVVITKAPTLEAMVATIHHLAR